MMTMDRDVFGTETFQVKDKRIFNYSTDYSDTANFQRYVTLADSSSGGGGNGTFSFADGSTISNYQYEVCWSINMVWLICPPAFSGSGSNNIEGCSYYSGTMSYCTTYETGGGYEGGPPGYPSGGGGGTWPFPPAGPGGGGAPCAEEFGASITNSFIPIECNPSGGNPWPPLPVVVQFLKTILSLNPVQTDWLTHNLDRANEILNYVQVNNGSHQLAKDHLNKMIQDFDFLLFVNDHAQTGDPSKMWWEDEVWLEYINYFTDESIYNFYMEATAVKNPRPIEFSDKCVGIPPMIQAAGDKKERTGYITIDGQFIYSPRVGTTGDVQADTRIRNGQVYYNYKMNLGAPSRTYFGMITDNVAQEYLIPVRTNIHVHIPDYGNNGVAITPTNPAKSEDDALAALQIQRLIQTFNFYVVEVKDNGKYLVASYSKDSPDYTIEGDDLLLLSDICGLIF